MCGVCVCDGLMIHLGGVCWLGGLGGVCWACVVAMVWCVVAMARCCIAMAMLLNNCLSCHAH